MKSKMEHLLVSFVLLAVSLPLVLGQHCSVVYNFKDLGFEDRELSSEIR